MVFHLDTKSLKTKTPFLYAMLYTVLSRTHIKNNKQKRFHYFEIDVQNFKLYQEICIVNDCVFLISLMTLTIGLY